MRKKQKIINLYQDESVGSIKHVISIGNEEDLNQFWHYFHSEVINDYRLLYHFIGLMYAFTSKLFEKEKDLFFDLIIEQNDELFYFTIWNADVSNALNELLQEGERECEYKIDKKRITIRLSKEVLLKQDESYGEEQKGRRIGLMQSLKQEKAEPYMPYTFLEKGDKEDILNICEDMSDMMYRAKKVGFQDDVFIRLRSCLTMFSLTLISYPQISHISNVLTEFSVLMNKYQSNFKEMSLEEVALAEGFVHNINFWANTLFVLGGADLHFMNNSLNADLQMIRMLIEPESMEAEGSLDDIFDF